MSEDEDVRVPKPGDPTACTLKLSARQLQVIYAGLDELPGRLSREVYCEIQRQIDAQVLEARRAGSNGITDDVPPFQWARP